MRETILLAAITALLGSAQPATAQSAQQQVDNMHTTAAESALPQESINSDMVEEMQNMSKKAMEESVEYEVMESEVIPSKKPLFALSTESATQRFENCIQSESCNMQQRFSILLDLETELQDATLALNENCRDQDYSDCLSVQRRTLEKWNTAYNDLGTIMSTIDPDFETHQSLRSARTERMVKEVIETEPAAGIETEEEKSWWEKLWDTSEEPME